MEASVIVSVAEVWAVIHGWLGRHHPGMLGLLRGPADPTEFGRLEAKIGYSLPDDFKASYLIHDGSEPVSGILIGLPLMPLQEVGRQWQNWADIADDEGTVVDLSEDCRSYPAGAVKPLYANRGWVPFAGDGMNFVALDFDPGPAGRPGQVINAGRDDEIRYVIAGNFADFLGFVASQFSAGRVVLNADTPPDAPRWLALAGGKRDLLTGLRQLLGLA
jgi:cell wall assembly regulator SMI1